MYRLRTEGGKDDPQTRWSLPERVFFACGACHILAHTFLETYPDTGFRAVWIRPRQGFRGNHIVAVRGQETAFDYHGYSRWPRLMEHFRRRAGQRQPGWEVDLIDLPAEVLVSEARSKTYDGLWLREPGQFLHNATPRAQAYLSRFPPPPPEDGNPADSSGEAVAAV